MTAEYTHDGLVTSAWIDGQASDAESFFTVTNPWADTILAQVGETSAKLASLAIGNAAAAFPEWAATAPNQRSAQLRRWGERLLDERQQLAKLVTQESGKPIHEAIDEVSHGASMLFWYAENLLRLHGETLPSHSESQQNLTLVTPLGVVAAITPWNFPVASVLVKCGAAIAAGNTCVLKPAEQTPLIALALARLATESGLPNGVFNVLPCSDPTAIGNLLCGDNRIRKLSFTGSVATGKQLYRQCSEQLLPTQFELGGNAPFIVFEDADIDVAVKRIAAARYYNGGQICVGANRIFVHASRYHELASQLAVHTDALVCGDPFQPQTQIGPQIHTAANSRLQALVESALAEGASKATRRPCCDEQNAALFYPQVLTDVKDTMSIVEQEVFGPIACLLPFHAEDEVLKRANQTQAGLAAYVFTRDFPRLWRCAQRLEAGVVGANSTQLFAADTPFGGIKQSGFGREQGIRCLEEFVYQKTICLGTDPWK